MSPVSQYSGYPNTGHLNNGTNVNEINKPKSEATITLIDNGVEITEEKEVANTLNNFFFEKMDQSVNILFVRYSGHGLNNRPFDDRHVWANQTPD